MLNRLKFAIILKKPANCRFMLAEELYRILCLLGDFTRLAYAINKHQLISIEIIGKLCHLSNLAQGGIEY